MTQPTIKLLLLAAIAVIGWYSLRGGRRVLHRVIWRAFIVLILGAGVLIILFPGSLTWLANRVGVGRGTDLLLYILVVTFGLVSVILFRRLDELERKYVAIARALAIQEASTDSQDSPRSRCASGEDADG
jgi:small membrane protein